MSLAKEAARIFSKAAGHANLRSQEELMASPHWRLRDLKRMPPGEGKGWRDSMLKEVREELKGKAKAVKDPLSSTSKEVRRRIFRDLGKEYLPSSKPHQGMEHLEMLTGLLNRNS